MFVVMLANEKQLHVCVEVRQEELGALCCTALHSETAVLVVVAAVSHHSAQSVCSQVASWLEPRGQHHHHNIIIVQHDCSPPVGGARYFECTVFPFSVLV